MSYLLYYNERITVHLSIIKVFGKRKESLLVGLGRSLEDFLNYKIDLTARFNRSRALVALCLAGVILISAGFLVFNRFADPAEKSYYNTRIEELQKLSEQHPEDLAVRLELAMTIYLKGEKEEGVRLTGEVLARNPENRDALLNMGIMLSDMSRYDESVTYLEKLIREKPVYAGDKAYFYLGKSYFAKGDYRQARLNLERAVQADSGSAVAYYFLGRSYEKLGEKDNALMVYRQAVVLAGTYPEAEAAVRRVSGK